MEKTSLLPPERSPEQNISAENYWGTPFPSLGGFLTAAGGNQQPKATFDFSFHYGVEPDRTVHTKHFSFLLLDFSTYSPVPEDSHFPYFHEPFQVHKAKCNWLEFIFLRALDARG